MPVSKKRKKDGRLVKCRVASVPPDEMKSGVSLQDLIDALAYQEYQKTKTEEIKETNG